MNELFQMIGTLASIGSVPLAFYLYFKSNEGKIERVKREIIKLLSYQIGEGREIKKFEINSVLKSKFRENAIPINKITSTEIIEDLVAETLSTPLLEVKRKEEIISELEKISTPNELSENPDYKSKFNNKSTLFGVLAFLVGILAFLLLDSSNAFRKLYDLQGIEGVLINITFGIIVAIISSLLSSTFSNIFKPLLAKREAKSAAKEAKFIHDTNSKLLFEEAKANVVVSAIHKWNETKKAELEKNIISDEDFKNFLEKIESTGIEFIEKINTEQNLA